YGPYGVGGAMAWINDGATAIVDAALPAKGVADPGSIVGIELTFSRADGAFFSPLLPAPSWLTTATFTTRLRDTYRSTGKSIDFGEDVDVTNTVTAQSLRPLEQSTKPATSATVLLTPG